MKKLGIKLSFLVLILTVFLTACSPQKKVEKSPANSSKKETSQEKKSEAKASKDVKANEPVKIQFWHINSDTMGGKVIDDMADKFNKSQNEVFVETVHNRNWYSGLMQNLQADLAAGNKPPALSMIGWSYKEYFTENFPYISPQEVANKHFPEDKDYLKNKFAQNVLDLASKNNEYIGFPFSVSTPVIYVNKDITDALGIDIDKDLNTWQGLKKAAKKIKDETGKFGLHMSEGDNWIIQQMMESNDVKVLTDGKASFATKRGFEIYQLYQDIVLKDKSGFHISSNEGTLAFLAGDIGIVQQSSGQRANVLKNSTFNVVGRKSPYFEGHELKVPAGGAFLAITATEEKEQKAAWKFLKFLAEPEQVADWTLGSGYLPITKDALDNHAELKDTVENDSLLNAAYSQLENLVPWASFPGNSGLQAEKMMVELRDKILSGEDVEKTMTETQDAINKLLE